MANFSCDQFEAFKILISWFSRQNLQIVMFAIQITKDVSNITNWLVNRLHANSSYFIHLLNREHLLRLFQATEFTVHSVDYFGERRYEGGDSVKCYFTPLENKVQLRKTQIQVHDNKDGSYTLRYVIDTEGSYKLHVIVNNFKIKNSPFLLRAIKGRTYADIQGKSPYLIFGGEGQEDGQLCRPWGICCDNDGFIYVADRSNNRVQVFDQAGNFKFKFGREGTKMGEFQRPASLAVDNKMKRLIVADKDNHRLQVFSLDGTWMSVIGEKGSQKGQFTYPWDVAVNSKSQILVSDTRNHRVQLLNHNGIFIYEYCLKEKVHDWQNHFDSPRGVCFTSDDWPIMNDFNKHRVLLIDKGSLNSTFKTIMSVT